MYPVSKGKISYALQAITILPLFFLGIAVLVLSSEWFTRTMYDEVAVELDNVAHNVVTLFEVAYEGDYHLKGDLALRLYKGEQDITGDYSLIDRVKADTGLDVTVFYQDTRILTTITNSEGERIIGTGAPDAVKKEVLVDGKPHFYNSARINTTDYFAYYLPLYNADGSIVGMVFAGKPSDQVNYAIRRSIYPLAVADFFVMLIAAVCGFLYTRDLASKLLEIHRFLSDISTGDLNAKLETSVLKRNDELGDIGRSALTMQRSLRNMVERDTLTGLFNRRFGNRKLHQVAETAFQIQTPFCVAIGDIDFFKNVNDTYGHECGDVVLKNVADKLRSHMYQYGFAARWGGEEFLLVFDHTNLEESLALLQTLSKGIQDMVTVYEDRSVQITMTFGLENGETADIKQLIRHADEKLYRGKNSGRNCIIS